MDKPRCGYCGKELKNKPTCLFQFGEPCDDQLQKQYEEDMQEREWEQQMREHYEWQRQMGEID